MSSAYKLFKFHSTPSVRGVRDAKWLKPGRYKARTTARSIPSGRRKK